MGDLQNFTEKDLQARFDEKNGSWLYNIARGIDLEPVQARFNPKSIGCCKQLRGKAALVDLDSLKKWLKDLGDEIENRLEQDALENNRTPKQMVVSFSLKPPNGKDTSSSRSYNFGPDDVLCGELFSTKALELVMDSAEGCKPKDGEPNRPLKATIKFLGISVGKFDDNNEVKKTKKIKDYFSAGTSKESLQISDPNIKIEDEEHINLKTKSDKAYVLNKFFQAHDTKLKSNTSAVSTTINNDDETKVLHSSLEKQESFFAKYLNAGLKIMDKKQNNDASIEAHAIRSVTPVCNIVATADDSNDTEYSGSTINEEINKSIALFEEDPDDVARVRDMRQLINKSVPTLEEDLEISKPQTQISKVIPSVCSKSPDVETIQCSECGKTLSLSMIEEHSDYHLALSLREEMRQELRKENRTRIVSTETKKESQIKKSLSVVINNKNDNVPSIANFFTKFDSSVETKLCTDCGKKVAINKFTEHLDFHEAQKLNRELNHRPTTINATNTSVKRKRKSSSPVKKPKLPCKSIDLFFRQ